MNAKVNDKKVADVNAKVNDNTIFWNAFHLASSTALQEGLINRKMRSEDVKYPEASMQ